MKRAVRGPKMSWLCVCILLLALTENSFATQTCAELQFKDFDNDTLYSKEGSIIRLVFNFTTDKCSQKPERVLFKVETKNGEYSVEFCKVTIESGSCKVSDSSSFCQCLDSSNTIEFSKEANRTDNRAFKWTWSDSLSQSQKERSIMFHVSYNKSDVSSKTELSIVAPPMFVTDETGTREFISTCRPLEGTRIMWDGVTCSHTNAKDGSCTFTPRVEDDGKLITCFAKDVVSGRDVSQASFTLQLSYPPHGSPMIEGLKDNQLLFVGDNLTLTCTVSGGKPLVSFVNFTCGQRTGTLMYTDTSVSSILTYPSLAVTDKDTKCHCAASWQPEKQLYQKEATTELVILENKLDWKLVITEEKSGEWITDGSIPFKLKCVAVNLNQQPLFKWHGEECEEKEGDVCSFTPSPPGDDGKLITCSVYNSSHGLLASTSYTVKLKYPPQSTPEIHGLVEGQHLLVGQTLTASCTVKGGNPPVATVRFTCGRLEDNNDNVNGDEVSSSVTFNPVTAEDNGTVCLCTAFWLPKKEFYVLKKSMRVTVSDAETSVPMGTMAAVTTVCIVIGIAVLALIAYFVIKRKARPYDHLNLKSQSYHCYRDPQTPRPTAPASSTDEETYEEVCDDPKAQVTAYEGIVSMRPHPGNRPTHSPKNRSLFPSNKRRCKEDKPDGQTPVTKTTITKTFSNKDRSIKAPTTQSDEYLEPVLAAKEKEQTLERPSSSHCNYYSYPSIAYNNQHPSNSSRSSKQPQ